MAVITVSRQTQVGEGVLRAASRAPTLTSDLLAAYLHDFHLINIQRLSRFLHSVLGLPLLSCWRQMGISPNSQTA